jgi:hypothetical protein
MIKFNQVFLLNIQRINTKILIDAIIIGLYQNLKFRPLSMSLKLYSS